MTDHASARPSSLDLLRCRADAPARVRDTLRAAGVDPEPFLAAAGLDAHPTRASAAARAYGLAVRATGARGLGLVAALERPLDWIAPLGHPARDASSLGALVGAVAEGLDRLVEGQRLTIRWTPDATTVEMTLPAGLDVAGKDVILGASTVFAWGVLTGAAGVPERALRVVSRVPPPPSVRRRVAVAAGDRWAIVGPPGLLRQPVDLSELRPTPAPALDRHDLLDRVRVAMLVALPGGGRLGQVARELAMAPRTLQLHLTAAGTSFGALLAEVRADVVASLADASRREVAAEVGYSSTTALARFLRTRPPSASR